MTREVLPDYSHPVLGVFERSKLTNHIGQTFVDLQKKGKTEILGLGFVFEDFNIILREVSKPPAELLLDLVNIIQWPKSRAIEVEDRLFEYYMGNRKEFLEAAEVYGLREKEIAKSVPQLKGSNEVWSLIKRPFYINGGTWDEPSIAFECTFEIEHELHIAFLNNQVTRIWNE